MPDLLILPDKLEIGYVSKKNVPISLKEKILLPGVRTKADVCWEPGTLWSGAPSGNPKLARPNRA